MLIRNTCCLQRGNVTSFRGYLRQPVVLPEEDRFYSLSFGFLKGFLLGKPCLLKGTGEGHLISGYGFPRKNPFLRKLKLNDYRPMDTSTLHAILHAQIDLLLGEQRDAVNNHENL